MMAHKRDPDMDYDDSRGEYMTLAEVPLKLTGEMHEVRLDHQGKSVTAGFYPFIDADGHQVGGFEVFEVAAGHSFTTNPDKEPFECGWYWWPCLPGCLPDSDPWGPFKTATQAYDNAQGDL